MPSSEGTDLEVVGWCLIQTVLDCFAVPLRTRPAPPRASLRKAFQGCQALSIVSTVTHVTPVPGNWGQGWAGQGPTPLPVGQTT